MARSGWQRPGEFVEGILMMIFGVYWDNISQIFGVYWDDDDDDDDDNDDDDDGDGGNNDDDDEDGSKMFLNMSYLPYITTTKKKARIPRFFPLNPPLLGQWLNFKVLVTTYLVGKIKFKLLFQGSLAK